MSTKRYRITQWRGHDNYECLLCPLKTLDRGRMVRHVRTEHPTEAEGAPPENALAGINFASDEAAETAAQLSAESIEKLKRNTPSGKTGGYTVADVKAARTNTQEA